MNNSPPQLILPRASGYPSGRLPGLDGLRAVSVAAVVLCHLQIRATFPTWPWLQAVAVRGTFGVTVFFVLSGFLITHLLLAEERASWRIRLLAFYTRRAYRILPAAFFYLAVVGVLSLLGLTEAIASDLLKAVLFIQNYNNRDAFMPVGHYWSLSVEEQFYLAWPLLTVFAPRTWRLPATVLLLAVAPVWRQYAIDRFGPTAGKTFIFHTDMVAHRLLTGCLLALVAASPRGAKMLGSRWLTGPVGWVAAAAAIGFALAPGVYRPFGTPANTIGDSVGPIGVALLINVCVHRSEPVTSRLLNAAPVTWIGRLSFGIYIWQQLFVFCPPAAWRWTDGAAAAVGATLVAAMFSYYAIEGPALRLRDQRTRARDVAVPSCPTNARTTDVAIPAA